MTDREIVERIVIDREGAEFTDDPNDRGHATRHGVTQRTFADFAGHPVTEAEVRALTRDDAITIMLAMFVARTHVGEINDTRLRAAVIDHCIHSGPQVAIRYLQKAAGVPMDGICGPVTLGAVNAGDTGKIREAAIAERLRGLGRIVKRDPQQVKWIAGWLNRVASVLEEN